MLKTITALVLSIAATGAIVIASAADAATPEDVTARVSYADLNLYSTAGQTALHRRVVVAAERLCGTAEQTRALADRTPSARCQEAAIARADMAIAAAVRAQDRPAGR